MLESPSEEASHPRLDHEHRSPAPTSPARLRRTTSYPFAQLLRQDMVTKTKKTNEKFSPGERRTSDERYEVEDRRQSHSTTLLRNQKRPNRRYKLKTSKRKSSRRSRLSTSTRLCTLIVPSSSRRSSTVIDLPPLLRLLRQLRIPTLSTNQPPQLLPSSTTDLSPLDPSHRRTNSSLRLERSEPVSLLSTPRVKPANLSLRWRLLLFLRLLLAKLEVPERVPLPLSPHRLLVQLPLLLQIFSSELNLPLSTMTTLADLPSSLLPVPTLFALNLRPVPPPLRRLDSPVLSRTSKTFDRNLRWTPQSPKLDHHDRRLVMLTLRQRVRFRN